jgi:hypothetical protein
MKNWQFIIAIFILIILICIKVKESFENNQIVYDINNTINYNESNYNVMNREMIEKNKTVIKEEDELVQKNKELTIKIPECNNAIIERTKYYQTVAIPNLNKANKDLQDIKSTIGYRIKTHGEREAHLRVVNGDINWYNTNGIPYYTNEVNNCNKIYKFRNNLPSGHYSIKSVKSNRYCTDTGEGVDCNADRLQGWERFYIENLGGGLFFLRGGRNGQLCADDRKPVFICNRNHLGAWEYTKIKYEGKNLYSLRGGRQGRLCSNTGRITCDRDHFLQWEQFIIEPWP